MDDARGRDDSNGITRGSITVDSSTALVDRATQADALSWSRICCNSVLEEAATRHSTSAVPVVA